MFIRHRLQGEYLSIICMHKFFKRPTPDKFEKFSLLQMQMASFLTCHRKMIIISPFIEIKQVSRKFKREEYNRFRFDPFTRIKEDS